MFAFMNRHDVVLANSLSKRALCLDKSVAISVLRVLDYLHVTSQPKCANVSGFRFHFRTKL